MIYEVSEFFFFFIQVVNRLTGSEGSHNTLGKEESFAAQ